MKCVVVYESKYGSTKRYAEWIAGVLQCDLLENMNIKAEGLKKYDCIIYGGGLYAGGIAGIELIRKNFEAISDKKIIVFTCGLADPTDQANTIHIREELNKALSAEMMEKITVFHLRGAIDYAKLGFVHKMMMSMLHKVLKGKDYDSLREEDKNMLDTYGKAVDFVDLKTAQPIVDFVEQLCHRD